MRKGYHNYDMYGDPEFIPEFEIDGTLYCQRKDTPTWWAPDPKDYRISLRRPVAIQIESVDSGGHVQSTSGERFKVRGQFNGRVGELYLMVATAPIPPHFDWIWEAIPLEEAHEYI